MREGKKRQSASRQHQHAERRPFPPLSHPISSLDVFHSEDAIIPEPRPDQPRLPGHNSSVTSGQPVAGAPMGEKLSFVPSIGSNSAIALSDFASMNWPSRGPATMSCPGIVMPLLTTVRVSASSPRPVFTRWAAFRYAGSQDPPLESFQF